MVFGEPAMAQTVLAAGGSIRFSLPAEHLFFGGGERDIWPYVLCEYPVSVLRLARTLYLKHGGEGLSSVVADLSLLRLEGWRLRPHSPNAIGYRLEDGKSLSDGEVLSTAPLRFQREEILAEPDRCAYRLLTRVYSGFGYREEDMPREFHNPDHRFLIDP